MKLPKILITNDDGIYAPGIKSLWKAMKEIGQVEVIAPENEQSAVGHAITISDPLRVHKIHRSDGFTGFAVGGTPADCVKIGIRSLLKESPDIIVSGINLGENTGTNIIYSGTVSAATEGTMLGIPSVAFSLDATKDPDFSPAESIAIKIVEKVLKNGLPQKTLLNVNIPAVPASAIKGFKITSQGNVIFKDIFERREDPKGKIYYWMTGNKIDPDQDIEKDHRAVQEGYVSITPIHYRLTNHEFMDELKGWDFHA